MNSAHIKGEVVSGFEFSHSLLDTKFYRTYIMAYRSEGRADTIPVIVSDKLVDINSDWTGYVVDIIGEFRSHNTISGGKRHLSLFVFAFEWAEDELGGSENEIYLDGRIGKDPVRRKISKGREITDILLAVNRRAKSDYIPCVVWDQMSLKTGMHVWIIGRMQSRTYRKGSESRMAYEVSVSSLEVID